MAFFDDKQMLLAHIRHSFITSDDTGMCELIMVNEDVDQEIKSDHSFQKKSVRMHQRYKRSQWNKLNYGASSFDIQTSPTLGRRPPMKNTSNMFQVIEEKKKKKNEKVKTIVWREPDSESFDSSLFTRQPISKPVLTGPSPLAKLLAEQEKKVSNPFFQYSKFNGENHGASSASKYVIFLAMAKDPLTPVRVSILHSATVEDLVGLTFWKYIEEEREPFQFKSLRHYAVMIAEDDGEIDIDLPELQKDDHIGKFGFKYLGIVDRPKVKVEEQAPAKKLNIVKVHYEHGGFSTIAVDNLQVEMSEILTRVIRKRRLQMQGYELERRDAPGELVDLSSTLGSLATMDFLLVGHSGHRSSFSGEEDIDTPTGGRYCNVKVELTSHQYKAYNVTLIQKKLRTKVQLGIDPKWIEIQPIDQHGRPGGIAGLLKSRPMSQVRYDISTVCDCELMEEKPAGQAVVRLTYYLAKEGFKSSEFETYTSMAKEIVRKVRLILEASPSNARAEYEKRDSTSRWKRGSKSFSSTH